MKHINFNLIPYMKFSSNSIVILLVIISSLFLYSCSHNSCPAYTYEKNNEIKKDNDFKENNTGIIRGT